MIRNSSTFTGAHRIQPGRKRRLQPLQHFVGVTVILQLDLDRRERPRPGSPVDHPPHLLQILQVAEDQARIVLAHAAFEDIDNGGVEVRRFGRPPGGDGTDFHVVAGSGHHHRQVGFVVKITDEPVPHVQPSGQQFTDRHLRRRCLGSGRKRIVRRFLDAFGGIQPLMQFLFFP
jgi:hypothetical protein